MIMKKTGLGFLIQHGKANALRALFLKKMYSFYLLQLHEKVFDDFLFLDLLFYNRRGFDRFIYILEQ